MSVYTFVVQSSWMAAPEKTLVINPDSRTVAGITGRVRDQTLQLLVGAMRTLCPDEINSMSTLCAQVEFELFKQSKVAAMYRTRMARLLTQIRRPQTTRQLAVNLLQDKIKQTEPSIGIQEAAVDRKTDRNDSPETAACFNVKPCSDTLFNDPSTPSNDFVNHTKRFSNPAVNEIQKPHAMQNILTKSSLSDHVGRSASSSSTHDKREPQSSTGPLLKRLKPESDSSPVPNFGPVSVTGPQSSLSDHVGRSASSSSTHDKREPQSSTGPLLKRLKPESDSSPVPNFGPVSVTGPQEKTVCQKPIAYFWERRPDSVALADCVQATSDEFPRKMSSRKTDYKRETISVSRIPDNMENASQKRKEKTVGQKPIVYFWERRSDSVALTDSVQPTSDELHHITSSRKTDCQHETTSVPRISDSVENASKKRKPLSSGRATDLAKRVVASLSTHFAKGRFHSKDVFKTVAKELTRRLLALGESNDPDHEHMDSITARLISSANSIPVSGTTDLNWDALGTLR